MWANMSVMHVAPRATNRCFSWFETACSHWKANMHGENEWNEVVKSHKTTGSILSKRTLLFVEAPTLTPSTHKSPVVGLGRHATMRANRPKCRSSRTTEHTAKWSFSSWILQDMEAILFRTLTNFQLEELCPRFLPCFIWKNVSLGLFFTFSFSVGRTTLSNSRELGNFMYTYIFILYAYNCIHIPTSPSRDAAGWFFPHIQSCNGISIRSSFYLHENSNMFPLRPIDFIFVISNHYILRTSKI